jgi:hypothetical protein
VRLSLLYSSRAQTAVGAHEFCYCGSPHLLFSGVDGCYINPVTRPKLNEEERREENVAAASLAILAMLNDLLLDFSRQMGHR